MSKKNPENFADAGNPKFAAFAMWMALGTVLGKQVFEGVENQVQFGKKYKINNTTLSRWKAKDEFWQLVKKCRQHAWRERFGNILLSVENKALREGSAAEAKLIGQMIGELDADTDSNLKVPEAVQKAVEKINKLLP